MASPLAAADALTPAASGGGVRAGYGVSLTDLSGFQNALSRAQAGGVAELNPQAVAAPSESMQALFKPLERLNAEAVSLHEHAEAAMATGNDMTPGEMVMLTVRAQEFLFHSQLTANVANRASDGLQQLFRQQA
ncbi:hypothetical protein [Ottowia testudinis]|uniref:Uncharacterized protein n=1 Tax=Ottowia testudinis TaxID=2816950 RepID=A0A975CGS0_9BURK|nr:hypothetical protein [Ottowia testudinis]QTD45501.1 hypothetical protein J1M35_00800 [Ottowia testudinis]